MINIIRNIRHFNTARIMVNAKVYIYEKPYHGEPDKTNFKLAEETLPPLKDGEFLAEATYLSVDPYMRIFGFEIGKPLRGEQVAKVVESKNSKFPVGAYILGELGWRTHTVALDAPSKLGFPGPRIIPDFGNLPKSLALGALGVTGLTAHFGLLDICKPKAGETLVVSGAGGATGSHAGQIGKIKGCYVVGITGTDEKGKWLVEELGFDAFVNYKDPQFEKKLAEATPNGIDCYYDNVGGEVSSAVIYKMNKFGRVAISGSISTYNSESGNLPKATEIQTPVKIKLLHVEGFRVYDYSLDQINEAIKQNLQWIKEGKLKYKETITEGFENMVDAFIGLFHGTNVGKAIIKV